MKTPADKRRLAGRLIVALLVLIGLATVVEYLTSSRHTTPVVAPQTLSLQGRLLIARANGVSEMDLSTGSVMVRFTPPARALIAQAALSPDDTAIVLAYAPPPDGPIQFGYTDLYTIPADGNGQPELLARAGDGAALYEPAWSPDGKWLYFARNSPGAFGVTQVDLMRLAYPGGAPQLVLVGAHAPAISGDGAWLAWVPRDSATFKENLDIGEMDAGNSIQLLDSAKFANVDAPRFSPDGAFLIFSAPVSLAVSQSHGNAADSPGWWEAFFGLRVAQAHSVPSDLWRIDVSGGQPVRLTTLADYGLSADFSPDGSLIAFSSASGIFVMQPDGSGLKRISADPVRGSLQWLP